MRKSKKLQRSYPRKTSHTSPRTSVASTFRSLDGVPKQHHDRCIAPSSEFNRVSTRKLVSSRSSLPLSNQTLQRKSLQVNPGEMGQFHSFQLSSPKGSDMYDRSSMFVPRDTISPHDEEQLATIPLRRAPQTSQVNQQETRVYVQHKFPASLHTAALSGDSSFMKRPATQNAMTATIRAFATALPKESTDTQKPVKKATKKSIAKSKSSEPAARKTSKGKKSIDLSVTPPDSTSATDITQMNTKNMIDPMEEHQKIITSLRLNSQHPTTLNDDQISSHILTLLMQFQKITNDVSRQQPNMEQRGHFTKSGAARSTKQSAGATTSDVIHSAIDGEPISSDSNHASSPSDSNDLFFSSMKQRDDQQKLHKDQETYFRTIGGTESSQEGLTNHLAHLNQNYNHNLQQLLSLKQNLNTVLNTYIKQFTYTPETLLDDHLPELSVKYLANYEMLSILNSIDNYKSFHQYYTTEFNQPQASMAQPASQKYQCDRNLLEILAIKNPKTVIEDIQHIRFNYRSKFIIPHDDPISMRIPTTYPHLTDIKTNKPKKVTIFEYIALKYPTDAAKRTELFDLVLRFIPHRDPFYHYYKALKQHAHQMEDQSDPTTSSKSTSTSYQHLEALHEHNTLNDPLFHDAQYMKRVFTYIRNELLQDNAFHQDIHKLLYVDPNNRYQPLSRLMYTALTCDPVQCDALLLYGASVNIKTGPMYNDLSPLLMACLYSQHPYCLATLKVLLRHGANALDRDGLNASIYTRQFLYGIPSIPVYKFIHKLLPTHINQRNLWKTLPLQAALLSTPVMAPIYNNALDMHMKYTNSDQSVSGLSPLADVPPHLDPHISTETAPLKYQIGYTERAIDRADSEFILYPHDDVIQPPTLTAPNGKGTRRAKARSSSMNDDDDDEHDDNGNADTKGGKVLNLRTKQPPPLFFHEPSAPPTYYQLRTALHREEYQALGFTFEKQSQYAYESHQYNNTEGHHLYLIQLLIENKADIESPNHHHQQPPILLAIKQNHSFSTQLKYHVVRMLLQAGASPNAVSPTFTQPLPSLVAPPIVQGNAIHDDKLSKSQKTDFVHLDPYDATNNRKQHQVDARNSDDAEAVGSTLNPDDHNPSNEQESLLFIHRGRGRPTRYKGEDHDPLIDKMKEHPNDNTSIIDIDTSSIPNPERLGEDSPVITSSIVIDSFQTSLPHNHELKNVIDVHSTQSQLIPTTSEQLWQKQVMVTESGIMYLVNKFIAQHATPEENYIAHIHVQMDEHSDRMSQLNGIKQTQQSKTNGMIFTDNSGLDEYKTSQDLLLLDLLLHHKGDVNARDNKRRPIIMAAAEAASPVHFHYHHDISPVKGQLSASSQLISQQLETVIGAENIIVTPHDLLLKKASTTLTKSIVPPPGFQNLFLHPGERLLQFLLYYGASPHTRDGGGYSLPFHYNGTNRHIYQFFLQAKVNFVLCDYIGNNILHTKVTQRNQEEQIKLILDYTDKSQAIFIYEYIQERLSTQLEENPDQSAPKLRAQQEAAFQDALSLATTIMDPHPGKDHGKTRSQKKESSSDIADRLIRLFQSRPSLHEIIRDLQNKDTQVSTTSQPNHQSNDSTRLMQRIEEYIQALPPEQRWSNKLKVAQNRSLRTPYQQSYTEYQYLVEPPAGIPLSSAIKPRRTSGKKVA